MQTLDSLAIPLQGQQLIEASAGTGKTYTIGLLYLRLLLERELTVDEILVVTFTNNATEELRTRIRARIKEMLDLLAEPESPGQDPMLHKLLANISDREHAQTLLRDGLTRMDEASVHTIHGFCQRMLREHAFESKSPFETEFLDSEQALRRRIMEDYWRKRFYPASVGEAGWAVGLWGDPSGLTAKISPLLAQNEAVLIPAVDPERITELDRTCRELFLRVCEQWRDKEQTVTDLLHGDKALSRNKKDGYHPDRLNAAFGEMKRYGELEEFPWTLAPEMALLCASTMAAKVKKKKVAPEHPFFHLFERFYTTVNEFTRLNMFHVQHEAHAYLRRELAERKESEGKIYFDDLLLRLDEALKGEGGNRLAAAIGKNFPCALVDEFQDTDPLQYRIFHTIYHRSPDCGFFMIGDPKQAIYSFRGADIFTYIKARRDTPEQGRYTMDTNYRASRAMVRAVNGFFAKPAPFVFEKDISFAPVKAAGKADRKPLLFKGHAPTPFRVLLLDDATLATSKARLISKDTAGREAAAWCAAEIKRLLEAGRNGEALIGDKPLRAGNIAILTRTHYEAETMRQALSKLGLASVYYSMESVFNSAESAEMYQLLHALTEPTNTTAVRTALVSLFFGYNGHDLDRLAGDQQAWEQLLNRVMEYHRTWNKLGFSAMFERLIAEQGVVSRAMARENGERCLTNLLHLAELLQEQNFRRPGMEELRRWLAEQISGTGGEQAGAAQQLRLESDENLIRIITIHKAKGLEYPVVFLPFIWSGRSDGREGMQVFHDTDDLRCIIDMDGSNEEHIRAAARERLAEDLRILYVALTRASYTCYLCWGRISSMEHSAAAYLLHKNGAESMPLLAELSRERILADIEALNREEKLFEVWEQPPEYEEITQVGEEPQAPLRAREFNATLRVDWRITSYSQLARGQEHNVAMDEPRELSPVTDDGGMTPHTFPRGPGAGLALHAILENIEFSSAGPELIAPVVSEQLRTAGIDKKWQETAVSWIGELLDTSLETESGFRLLDLAAKDRLNEMHFYFSLTRLDYRNLNRVLSAHHIPPLGDGQRISGLMTGFIDLFFRHQGRYYLADYKSNHLGSSLDAYDRASMERAMLEHRYDLQYLIYTLAVHRYLATRIADYDYRRDFGGVYYLFLRGMNPEGGPGRGIYRAKPDLGLIEELDRCCRVDEEETC